MSLDIDELEAASLVFYAEQHHNSSNSSLIYSVIHNFHDRRDLLLQTLRLILQYSFDIDTGLDDENQELFQDTVALILDTKTGPPSNGSAFARKCLKSLEDLERWQTQLTDQLQSREVLGQTSGWEIHSTLDFQKASLFKQHEALAVSVAHLFRGNRTISEDLRKLLEIPKRWEYLDLLLVHYMPAFSAAFSQHGSPDRATSLQEARSLDSAIQKLQPAQATSSLAPFYASLRLWWIVEYSGWYRPVDTGSPQILQDVDADQETRIRMKVVETAVLEHALEYMLSLCAGTVKDTWNHPARQELVSLLLSDGNIVKTEGDQTSAFFTLTYKECLESFSEAWIFNLPDSIRRLKNEEDDQRLRHITALQEGGSNVDRNSAGPLHLEAFLVIISFAFGGRPEAAEQFWSDADNGLHGFLVWASKRQTVPRVSAFCEMLCSISEGPECAPEAHRFLLDESAPTASKTRRTPTMNYYQMLSELELYSRKIHERPPAASMSRLRKVLATDMNETESPVMLSSYLRLITHMCQQHPPTRTFLLQSQNVDFIQTLLILSSGPVPSYLRASIFSTITGLLVEKSEQLAASTWRTIDQWASCGYTSFNPAQAGQVPTPSVQILQNTLTSIASAFDQYDAFVMLLHQLLLGPQDDMQAGHQMAFPEDLGATYRSPGVSPYIDFVCGQLFAKRLIELPDEPQTQLFRLHCLDVIATCLETFNENYLRVDTKKSSTDVSTSNSTPSSIYAQRHPFARVMDWLLSEDVNNNLMASTHISSHLALIDEVGSPTIWCLQRSIDVINFALEFQPTFLDIVRPIVRQANLGSRVPISTNTCIEDGIISHPELISDLCLYVASENTALVLKSVTLLESLSTLRKLNPAPLGEDGVQSKSKRLVDMLGPNASTELAPVIKSLSSSMQPTSRELEAGPESPRYIIKNAILSFLEACLRSQRDIPNLAHLLLGFGRAGNLLVIEANSLMESDATAFRGLIDLVHEYEDIVAGTSSSWLAHLRASAMQVLELLWSSHVSTDLTMIELRRHQFLQTQFISQSLVSQDNIWDKYRSTDPEFWSTASAEAMADFLSCRTCLYEYTVSEIKASKTSGLLSLQKSLVATILGKSTDLDGSQIPHVTLLELFDFADIDIQKTFGMPTLRDFTDIDFDSYASMSSDEAPIQYDMNAVHEALLQHLNHLISRNQGTPALVEEWLQEAGSVVSFLEAENRWALVRSARSRAMHMWATAVIATLEFSPMEPSTRLQFILRTLEVILPKIDAVLNDEPQETVELARVGDALLDALTQLPTSQMHGRVEANALEKLFQLFRSCLEGISVPTSTPMLRALLYTICARYLGKLTSASQTHGKLRRNAMDCVRSAGMPLISILSDDADEGDDDCKLSSLDLLSMLTSLSRSEKSIHALECLVKLNAVEIIIEPLKHIAVEFQDTEVKERALMFDVLQTRLLLLLQISRTREGSGYLLDAGMLQAIRESMLFRADPDLGIDLDNAQALHNYYELVALTLRLLVSTFVNRGLQNEQCQFLLRGFLSEYRPNMVGLFKRFSGVNGTVPADSRPVLRDIIKGYTALASATGFVEVCVAQNLHDTLLTSVRSSRTICL